MSLFVATTPSSVTMLDCDAYSRPSHVRMVTIEVNITCSQVNNRNTITSCGICLKLTIKKPERYYFRRYGVFIVNFEYISHLVLLFLL